MNQTTIYSPEEIPNFWPADEFLKVYSGPLTGCKLVVLSDEDDPSNPDKTALIILRTHIEDFHVEQKYIVGISFINFGQIMTIDVLSFNQLEFHREMCAKHCLKMNWPLIDGIGEFEKTYHTPFLFVGGFVSKENEQLFFSSESGDYGKEILISDANAIATYVAKLCLHNEEVEGEGKSFIEEVLLFLQKNKGEQFFESLIPYIYERAENRKNIPEAQHLAALVTMKAFARSVNEQTDMLGILVQELMNLGNIITVSAVAWNLRQKNDE